MCVAQLDDARLADPTRAATTGLLAPSGPELVTGGIHGAFRPVRERIVRGTLRAIHDGADGFVVPISSAWLAAFVEEICPDRDTPCANQEVWPVWGLLNGAVENGRWALVG